MADAAMPIAYTGLQRGTPMLTQSGRQFGRVEHVLQVPEEDLFDGIVSATDQGLRFVDRDRIAEITTAWVRCDLSDDQAAGLPAPEGPPVFSVDGLQDIGGSLHDRLGRLFGRSHWTREE
jgi:hypothetical protein